MTIAENPFFVLGLDPDASRIEVEREAQKLLCMLELEFAAAQHYDTPVGPQPRTSEAVRAAVAALRDPYRRLVAELWARHVPRRACHRQRRSRPMRMPDSARKSAGNHDHAGARDLVAKPRSRQAEINTDSRVMDPA
ncbi:MAG: hypothetical protein WKG01_42700 [Kofleriaceae bacterium]